jgi:hypothetical protein
MIRKGVKTQTINICTEENVRARYDYIVRLQPPFVSEETLKGKSFESIEVLVRYLEVQHGGIVEKRPKAGNANRSGIDIESAENSASSWIAEAVNQVEVSINHLIREFIQYPYLHRVEHSIHCELYRILTSYRLFMTSIPVERWSTQPIQKEWPEWTSRPEKSNRRGNFDLCVIAPQDFKDSLLNDYRDGRIKPSIVIELGLDYGPEHLRGDANKLINSKIERGYLIHLLRAEKVDAFETAEDFLLDLERDYSTIKTAYAGVTSTRVAFKLIGDTAITKYKVKGSSQDAN